MPPLAWDRKHLLQLEGLSAADLNELLDAAERHLTGAGGRFALKSSAVTSVLAGRTIANLFFEDSTRTRCSFTLAAMRLGARTIDITSFGSSVSKGETIVDTALNILAMGVDGFVVRSAASGAGAMIANAVGNRTPVINAGDGRHEHPTQGLLDLLTLRQRLGNLHGKTVAIVGDIVSSRVARSAIHGLTTLGANVILVGPPTLVPKVFQEIIAGPGEVSVTYDLDDILPVVDAIMMLRVQFERASGGGGAEPGSVSPTHPTISQRANVITGDYRQLYGLNAPRAARLPEHAIVLHPGPMNRGLEIDSDVADDPKRSVILQQVTNGVGVRMAVLAKLVSRIVY